MTRATIAALCVAGSACHGRPVVRPDVFPMGTAWTSPVGESIEGPLATDGVRLFVATRDGPVPALARGGRGRARVALPHRWDRGRAHRRRPRPGPLRHHGPALPRPAPQGRRAALALEGRRRRPGARRGPRGQGPLRLPRRRALRVEPRQREHGLARGPALAPPGRPAAGGDGGARGLLRERGGGLRRADGQEARIVEDERGDPDAAGDGREAALPRPAGPHGGGAAARGPRGRAGVPHSLTTPAPLARLNRRSHPPPFSEERHVMSTRTRFAVLVLAAVATTVACGGGEKEETKAPPPAAGGAPAAPGAGAAAPAAPAGNAT